MPSRRRAFLLVEGTGEESKVKIPAASMAGLLANIMAKKNAAAKQETAPVRADDADVEPKMPRVTLGGSEVDRPISDTVTVGGRTLRLRSLHEELELTYVHGLVDPAEMASLVRLADARNGFVRSPLRRQGGGEDLEGSNIRTSSSCPMLWPLLYESRRPQLVQRGLKDALAELDLVGALAERTAGLLAATGRPRVTARCIEPLQVVRYQPGERFGPHHDYHEVTTGADADSPWQPVKDPAGSGQTYYWNKETNETTPLGAPKPRPKGSSVQGEQRAFTVLLFGGTLPPDAGGETHFPELGVMVSPRLGDALIWSNVDETGAPNPRSLHEGRRPADGYDKVAVNVWVADREFQPGADMARAVQTR